MQCYGYTWSYFKEGVPIWATLDFKVACVAWGVIEAITDCTYNLNDYIKIPTNGFSIVKELDSHSSVLGVMINNVQKHCQQLLH